MRPNPQEPADLVTFTADILNGKLHFLCSVTNKELTRMKTFEAYITRRESICETTNFAFNTHILLGYPFNHTTLFVTLMLSFTNLFVNFPSVLQFNDWFAENHDQVWLKILSQSSETYSKHCQTSKMEFFVKI